MCGGWKRAFSNEWKSVNKNWHIIYYDYSHIVKYVTDVKKKKKIGQFWASK